MFSKLFNKLQDNKKSLYKDITVILDAGHGSTTSGKRSPKDEDGNRLYEWQYNRDIVNKIAQSLKDKGIKYEILVPEDTDVSLTERVSRANKIYSKTGNRAFLISIHGNAAGNGNSWTSGRGWEVWTSVGKTKSDDIATIFWNEMKEEFPSLKMRLDTSDGDVDKESDFYILKKTKCPAILTENFFYDNKLDYLLMIDNKKRIKIANAHVRAICKVLLNLY